MSDDSTVVGINLAVRCDILNSYLTRFTIELGSLSSLGRFPDTIVDIIIVDTNRLTDKPSVIGILLDIIVEFGNLIAVEREGQRRLPGEIGGLDRYSIELQVDTPSLGPFAMVLV